MYWLIYCLFLSLSLFLLCRSPYFLSPFLCQWDMGLIELSWQSLVEKFLVLRNDPCISHWHSLWIPCHSRIQELRDLGELSPHWDNLRKEVIGRYGQVIAAYQETLAELNKITGKTCYVHTGKHAHASTRVDTHIVTIRTHIFTLCTHTALCPIPCYNALYLLKE